VRLTDPQRHASAAYAPRTFIEAGPGSGKTTVAAERYGVLRYANAHRRGRSLLAVSFTRSATRELRRRIVDRWGGAAVAWPHRVVTLDTLHTGLVTQLLRSGWVEWPGRHTELTVLDVWRGHPGARYLLAGDRYRRVATLNGFRVVSTNAPVGQGTWGIGARERFEEYLADGVCTHGEIRQVLAAALRNPDLRDFLAEHLGDTVGGVVVDEVFDANQLDLALVRIACEAGIPVTLIGDPWQALYGFRGARPDLVLPIVDEHRFIVHLVPESFRFETRRMRALAADLRAGHPVTLPTGRITDLDVLLASRWETLWNGPDRVLPLSFGKIDNLTDAAIVLLVDRLVTARFGHGAIFLAEALSVLGLDRHVLHQRGPAVLDPVAATLAAGAATERALDELRDGVVALGGARRPPRLTPRGERAQLDRLAALRRRLFQHELIPGMTVHQAKGREWPVVGVALTDAETARLAAGLCQDSDDDRRLYVALTRARRDVVAIEVAQPANDQPSSASASRS
jgi:DNA helicase-2/ATP-dependent DNA helicase PcrA